VIHARSLAARRALAKPPGFGNAGASKFFEEAAGLFAAQLFFTDSM
jgi:hypothetical protein